MLETEPLLKDKETTSGKISEESTMILNLKEAIDFIVANPDYLEINGFEIRKDGRFVE